MKIKEFKNNCGAIRDCIFSIGNVLLLGNMTVSLIANSWQGQISIIYRDTYFLWAYFGAVVLCLIPSILTRVTKLSVSKDGVSAELAQIEAAKQEVLATKEEVLSIRRDLYKNILKMTVIQMENAPRWDGWSQERLNNERLNILKKCKEQQFSELEQLEVLQPIIFWRKVDLINPIKDEIKSHFKDPEQEKLVEEEWTKIIEGTEMPNAGRLDKFINQIPEESAKNKLRNDVKNLPEFKNVKQVFDSITTGK